VIQPMSIKKVLCALFTAGASLSACVNPQQVEFLEREQRRVRSDMKTLHSDVEGFRTTLADTRADANSVRPIGKVINASRTWKLVWPNWKKRPRFKRSCSRLAKKS
jgi:outer membrane murein-binding lipoprotein Lpp